MVPKDAKERKKNIKKNYFLLSLDDIDNIKGKCTKKNAKKYIVIFWLQLSLRINEKNKRERKEKSYYALWANLALFLITTFLAKTFSLAMLLSKTF